MKINQQQKNAQVWNKSLNKLNEAQIGQIAVYYVDSDNRKRLGYVDPLKLEIVVRGDKMTLGDLLEKHDSKVNIDLKDAKDEIVNLKKQLVDLGKQVNLLNQIEIAKNERGLENEKDITY